jgi:hypothetical protein
MISAIGNTARIHRSSAPIVSHPMAKPATQVVAHPMARPAAHQGRSLNVMA